MPIVGALLYLLFGINRVRMRAREIGGPRSSAAGYLPIDRFELPSPPPAMRASERLFALSALGGALTGLPLTEGNRIEVLAGGEQAYRAMLAAIDQATQRVWLCTYIFESDAIGEAFVDALAAARRRGVDVRVIVDGLGQWYTWPPAQRLLRRAAVPYAIFLPPRLLPPSLHINLRNHRKLLIADAERAFTGGMNIGGRHVRRAGEQQPRVRDTHFALTGPVAAQMADIFLEDWRFCTGEEPPDQPEAPQGQPQHAPRDPSAGALCRVIADGPNDEVDKIIVLLIGAIANARRRVLVVTPYFLPTRELVGALQSAALRGIEVTVLLPERNNLRYVHWASRHLQERLLKWGVVIRYQPGGFVHSKLFVVDDDYLLIGSPNLDDRSLRLNFELAVEIIDHASVAQADAQLEPALLAARRIEAAELRARPPIVKVRDALCWLFSPYL